MNKSKLGQQKGKKNPNKIADALKIGVKTFRIEKSTLATLSFCCAEGTVFVQTGLLSGQRICVHSANPTPKLSKIFRI